MLVLIYPNKKQTIADKICMCQN